MILILVNSSNKGPYKILHEVQEKTWNSEQVEGVETIFYLCDRYDLMHVNFREVLKSLNLKGVDYIFRTNASSYVDKRKLLEFSKKIPAGPFYSGKNGGGFASGCGFWLSTDLVPLLIKDIPSEQHPYEDVLIGNILSSHGIPVSDLFERCDYYEQPYFDTYHYRCKPPTSTPEMDREEDMAAMLDIHNRKTKA